VKTVGKAESTGPTYIVLRTDKIGDVLLSLSAADAIKGSEPDSSVVYVTSSATSELARACPLVDRVIEFDEAARSWPATRRLAREMKALRADAAIFLRPRFHTAIAAALAGIPVRAGTAYRPYSFLFNRRVAEHRRQAARHETQYNLAIVRAALHVEDRVYLPRIALPESSRAYAGEVLRDFGLSRKAFVALHPGSAGSARNLPIASYAALADAIERQIGVPLLLTCGPDEAEVVGKVDSFRKEKSKALVGTRHLLDLAAVASEACIFISGSTGPMHLASAVGTPTVSFFSPARSCSPRRWGPLGAIRQIILPPVPECPRCSGRKCEHYDCMAKIETGPVVQSVKELLETCRWRGA
jgi:heptosyltransferase-3